MHIGLTGGIGSGKSTVARLWVALGAQLIDTDQIARDLTLPNGAAMPKIERVFGAGMISADGSLNRAAMRERAFTDPGVLAQLQEILHPLIGVEAQRQVRAAATRADPVIARPAVVLFDVPLLTESRHWRERVDRVVVVDCGETTQVNRVVARSGWPEDQVHAVMQRQATRRERRAIADAVICNDGLALETLAEHVAELHQRWLGA
jgi:dephospho-CoA kinase